LACIILLGCEDNRRQQQLDLRERRLLRKEKQFSLNRQDYSLLLKIRNDIIAKADTVLKWQWPPDIAGVWKGKSVCTAPNCTRYAVGDKRSYTWEFISDSNGLYTRASNNHQLIRIYSARLDSTGIHLFYKTESSGTWPTELTVRLDRINPNLLKGAQTVSYDNSCQARLSMDLSRAARFRSIIF
jgi:hypothetical protein